MRWVVSSRLRAVSPMCPRPLMDASRSSCSWTMARSSICLSIGVPSSLSCATPRQSASPAEGSSAACAQLLVCVSFGLRTDAFRGCKEVVKACSDTNDDTTACSSRPAAKEEASPSSGPALCLAVICMIATTSCLASTGCAPWPGQGAGRAGTGPAPGGRPPCGRCPAPARAAPPPGPPSPAALAGRPLAVLAARAAAVAALHGAHLPVRGSHQADCLPVEPMPCSSKRSAAAAEWSGSCKLCYELSDGVQATSVRAPCPCTIADILIVHLLAACPWCRGPRPGQAAGARGCAG